MTGLVWDMEGTERRNLLLALLLPLPGLKHVQTEWLLVDQWACRVRSSPESYALTDEMTHSSECIEL